ncbi:hypothetical protein FKM82_015538 [Ascaphus truei]
MAEETRTSEYNGTVPLEKAQVQISDIIDQMATSAGTVQCETPGCDSGFILTKGNKEESKIHLENKATCITQVLGADEEKRTEVKHGESSIMLEKEPEAIICQGTETDEDALGGCNKKLDSESDSIPACAVHEQNDLTCGQQHKEQAVSLTETVDLLRYTHGKNLSGQAEDEIAMPETQEIIKPLESDKENEEDSLFDEQENGPEESLSVSPSVSHSESIEEQQVIGSRPDISRHSYSRYDTVSYRKIRKGNTKQRIDEFESMMNL